MPYSFVADSFHKETL